MTLIGSCGSDCVKCDAYLVTQADDDDQRAKVAKEWSIRYSQDFKPEQINCNGCLAEGRKFFYCDVCEIRLCSIDKGVENCAGCDEYPCAKLEEFFQDAPEGRVVLDALRA